MTNPIPETIENQIQALCASIAAAPEVQAAREQAESFLADEAAVGLYRDLMNLGGQLQQLHQSGAEIDDDQIQRFEELRTQSNNHAGIQAFHQAQDVLQAVANAVNQFVTKTLEKGAVPSREEVFAGGSCGAGCGCH
jgi:cell fate (sporulation/competence/biofilm development) regulator YlbF (YheA/YmcA/DUF963 family)